MMISVQHILTFPRKNHLLPLGLHFLILVLICLSPDYSEALDAKKLFQKSRDSVVLITSFDQNNQPLGFGSGFYIDDAEVGEDYSHSQRFLGSDNSSSKIITNQHVIKGAKAIQVKHADGKVSGITTILGIDEKHDIAVLEGPTWDYSLTFSQKNPEIGDEIIAIGNPQGLERTLSMGIISGVRRSKESVFYQITAPISPGSSGGPIINEQGEVIGISTFYLEGGQNLNFAIPSDYIKKLLHNLAPQKIQDLKFWEKPLVEEKKETESSNQPPTLNKQVTLDEAVEDNNRGDYILAFQKFHLLADQGIAEAQLYLGYMYADGTGADQDNHNAVKWYRKAAEQGLAEAQYELGGFYHMGSRKIPQDYYEAEKWYRKAAEQGFAKAQMNLGGMYATGQGVQRNDREGEKWTRKAAEQGYGEAQLALGVIYDEGRGVVRDKTEAARWYWKAVQGLSEKAEQGDGLAQFSLGMMYMQGRGVAQDYVEAHKWLNLATSQGFPDAVQRRDQLIPLMTSSQLAKAQELARNWRPK